MARSDVKAEDRRRRAAKSSGIPVEPGYYWAWWERAADGTHEASDLVPAHKWEIVQVNDNNVDDPNDDEYLTVSVPGVRETQWRDGFTWGPFVRSLAEPFVDRVPQETQMPLSLAVKLGSIAVHAHEMTSPEGHAFDSVALDSLLRDPEVIAWLETMDNAALLPRKRATRGTPQLQD